LRAFDIVLDHTTKLYLDHLICCIDRVDNALDSLKERTYREELTNAMISIIDGKANELRVEFSDSRLESSLLTLREIADRKGIKSPIINAARKIFKVTEDNRHETNIDTFISLVQEEGIATSILPLSIIADVSNKQFVSFFTSLCRLMGIADLVADANDDYRSDLISFKPSLSIYFKLIKITISEGIKLLVIIPHKFRFLQYCLRFLIVLAKK